MILIYVKGDVPWHDILFIKLLPIGAPFHYGSKLPSLHYGTSKQLKLSLKIITENNILK